MSTCYCKDRENLNYNFKEEIISWIFLLNMLSIKIQNKMFENCKIFIKSFLITGV